MKLRAGKVYVPVKHMVVDDRIYMQFGFNKALLKEIKALEGAYWHGFKDAKPVPKQLGTNKVWSIPITDHNMFQLSYLDKDSVNPYAIYDKIDFSNLSSDRPLMDHQLEMKRHILTVHYGIWAVEMGAGKTLAAIDAIEDAMKIDPEINNSTVYWFGPRSALAAVELEFEKWDAKITPKFYTYDGLKKVLENWDGKSAPLFVVFDESSKIKTSTSKRAQAAKYLADHVRKEHGMRAYILGMTGTPAPKSPVDWWSQVNIIRPGFLVEGSRVKFERRLSLIKEKENVITGGVYPHKVTWWDNTNKCQICGDLKESHDDFDHPWVESVDEIKYLAKRLKGLVYVKFKKDCINLPDKQYRVINIKPSQSILNAAKMIKSKAPTAIQALTLLRELSDGFQYTKTKTGEMTCSLCKGSGTYREYFDPNQNVCRICEENKENQSHWESDDDFYHKFEPIPSDPNDGSVKYDIIESVCINCKGKGVEDVMSVTVKELASPKDNVVRDLLEEYEDVGRVVTYAGFTGSIDKLVKLCRSIGWDIIKLDGRGWTSTLPGKAKDWLRLFQTKNQELREKYQKIVFIAQPESGGMGLTLTASPVIIFYSNTFNGEARTQAADRIHRTGMDTNRGATIIDLIHLPSDQLVLDNITIKRNMELMTMGELENLF